jgi:hypothetical protein
MRVRSSVRSKPNPELIGHEPLELGDDLFAHARLAAEVKGEASEFASLDPLRPTVR